MDRPVKGALRYPRDTRALEDRPHASHGCVRLTNWDVQRGPLGAPGNDRHLPMRRVSNDGASNDDDVSSSRSV